ncbi:hypothetical protein ETB97_012215 [Aspergillus alliaceus]|uniref:Zn(2)-C6 fungal-type domain-containing protein n=1 Tax=Petromyces alliaceus TaxID=209559 RepID=A0A8H6E848_PETAA|nr:hypothetical protein ETB97_012215 [Aspergillus burnettii]
MASHPPGRLLLSAPSTGLPRSENAIRTRTKKAPCSGGVPCDRCQHSQATCILDEYSDGRRKAGIERRLEVLERDRCLLMGLVGSIRNDNEHELNRALDSIRRNDSLDEIRQSLAESQAPGELEHDQQEVRTHPCPNLLHHALNDDTCGMGKNMLGWQYLVEIADCAQELMIRRNTFIARAREQDQEISRALNVAIIGSLSVPPVAFASLHQLSIMPEPTCERPPQDHSEGDMWFPYPLKSDSVSTHGNCVTNALFNLQLILWDVSNSLFGASGQQLRSSSEDMANAFKQRLEEWALQIPECAMLETGKPTPAILDMQLVVVILSSPLYPTTNTAS